MGELGPPQKPQEQRVLSRADKPWKDAGPVTHMPIQTSEGWAIRDVENGKTLLGVYDTEEIAQRNCRRLDANLNLTPNEMRALKTLAIEKELTYSSLAFAFWQKWNKGAEEKGRSLAKFYESHGLAKPQDDNVVITEWGREFLGLK